ncbi:hypothetical protein O7630_18380 [Micromonospora sp. WMMD718]|uniref:Uncharacterized protein n=3 Tax=Micromonospora aurantiaca (nom. illeg.) TaxID=47850 RepID=A0A6N3K7S5_9ACTN|nr:MULTISPECIES: hypothetical protein [Micromonospora]AXH93722.1 hypothetical protein DVH21_29585 [Micromonospora aurantiaca]MDG4752911.1 hypothetical protein [Micromonospora sp. WMMD718]OHX06872.1 hypothetical protein BFV98_29745 [Micromonospora sp. WMMB235]
MTTSTSFDAPLAAITNSLTQLRDDVGSLVDAASRHPTAQRRAALVDVHHQLRLLGQRVNAALGSPPAQDPPPHEPPEQA